MIERDMMTTDVQDKLSRNTTAENASGVLPLDTTAVDNEEPAAVVETERAKTVEIELINHRAMLEIPEDAVEVTINCMVFHGGKLISVSKTLSFSDVREAFKKADDGYIDEDDRFVLTEKGKEFLRAMVEDDDE